MIARAADGSMRDALSLTDQVLALGDGGVTAQRVREALGLVAEDEYIALLDVIGERRAGDTVGRLVDLGVDLGQFLAGLGDILRAQLALALGAREVEVSAAAREALEARKERLAPGDILAVSTPSPSSSHASGGADSSNSCSRRSSCGLPCSTARSTSSRCCAKWAVVAAGRVTVDRAGAEPARRAVRHFARGAVGRGVARGYRAAPPVTGDSAPRADISGRRETPVDTPRVGRAHSPAARGRAAARAWGGPPSRGDSRAHRMEAGPGLEREVGGRRRRCRHPRRSPNGCRRLNPSVGRYRRRRGAGAPLATLDINHLVERWDDIVVAIRRDRPIVGTLVEKAIPTAVTSSGVVSLQIEDMGAFESLAAKAKRNRHVAAHRRAHARPAPPPRLGQGQQPASHDGGVDQVRDAGGAAQA